MSGINNLLYPNVTTVPSQGVESKARIGGKDQAKPGEFDELFQDVLKQPAVSDLSNASNALKFSAHATKRLVDRNIKLDPEMMSRVRDAVDKAASKGVEDTLVLTPDAALIVSVKNRTVVTAMDRSQLDGNVFTNIDGAVVV